MKIGIKIVSTFALCILLVCALCSCDFQTSSNISLSDLLNSSNESDQGGTTDTSNQTTSEVYVTNIKEEDGSFYVYYSNGTKVLLGNQNVTNNVTNNNITIENQGTTSGFELVSSKALVSTVQVICQFTEVYYYQTFRGIQTQESTAYSSGSGVIYSLDKTQGSCYIITNFHVVYDSNCNTSNKVSDAIYVYLYGESQYCTASFVGGSALYDIAVLKIENSEVLKNSCAEIATIANSNNIHVGANVLAVGNPEGEGLSVTQGIISVDSESINLTAVDNSGTISVRVIRIDAAVNSGNSGGGLYNANGELIGIVNAKVNSDDIENIGYAIPSNVAVSIAQNIIDYNDGYVYRAIMGITLTAASSKGVYDKTTGLTSIVEVVKVTSINTGSIAETAGVQANDILKKVKVGSRDALDITRTFELIDECLNARVGDTVQITVERDGVEQVLSVTITQECLTKY